MEPQALDIRRRRTRTALLAAGILAMASQVSAVSVRGIYTQVKDREGYTRCIVELSGETRYFQSDFLERRKYFLVDIFDVSPRVAERFITPNTGPVVQIHALNHKGSDENNALTLVFHLTDVRRYRVFSVENPFRVVIDVLHGTEGLEPSRPAGKPTPTPTVGSGRDAADSTDRRLRKEGKKIVIIDPGHGGGDTGALSYLRFDKKQIREKDINLTVANLLKTLIDASPNMEAYLTRDSDKYVSLADRRDFYKKFEFQADLFVSIHCNASDSYRTRGARGLELYYLNPRAATKGAKRYLEEIENRNGGNGDAPPNLNHPIFKQLAQETYTRMLHEGRVVCDYLKAACYQIDYYKRNNNRESVIQSANFYVLYQREMPAVLVELGFLTNSYDCRNLVDPQFQRQAATALYNGVCAYFNKRDDLFNPKYVALPAGP